MVNDMTHNLDAEPVRDDGANTGRPPLDLRLQKFAEQEDAGKKFNGGCPISADIDKTLELLRDNVKPYDPDLPGKAMASLEKYLQAGQKIEDVWMQKIAEGANYIGIVGGEVDFYRGEEKLALKTVPLEFPIAPRVMRFREVERGRVKYDAKLARQRIIDQMSNKNKENNNIQDNDNIYS